MSVQAAEYLVRTGPTVTLEVAKQGAMLHGLATLLHQPAYNNQRPGRFLFILFTLKVFDYSNECVRFCQND